MGTAFKALEEPVTEPGNLCALVWVSTTVTGQHPDPAAFAATRLSGTRRLGPHALGSGAEGARRPAGAPNPEPRACEGTGE